MSGRLDPGGATNGADDEEDARRNGRAGDPGITPGDGGEPTREPAEEDEPQRNGRAGDPGITPGDGGEPTREPVGRRDPERGGAERALDPGRADRARAGREQRIEETDATTADGLSRRRQLQRRAAAQTGADPSQVTVVERDGELQADLTAEGRAQAAVAGITRDRRRPGAGIDPGAALGPGQLALVDADREELDVDGQPSGPLIVSGPATEEPPDTDDERDTGFERRLEALSDRFQSGVDTLDERLQEDTLTAETGLTAGALIFGPAGIPGRAIAPEATDRASRIGLTQTFRGADPAGLALTGIDLGRAGVDLQRDRVSSAQAIAEGEGDFGDVARVGAPLGTRAFEEREQIAAAVGSGARSARSDPIGAFGTATGVGGTVLLTGGATAGAARGAGAAGRAARGVRPAGQPGDDVARFLGDTRGTAQVPRGRQRPERVEPAPGRSTPDADPRVFERARRRTGGRMADPGEPAVGTRPARAGAGERGEFRRQVQRARVVPDDDLRAVAASDFVAPAAVAPTGTGPAAAFTVGAQQRLRTAQSPTVTEAEALVGRAEDTSFSAAPTGEVGLLATDATATELDTDVTATTLERDAATDAELDAAAEQVTDGLSDGLTTGTGQTGRTTQATGMQLETGVGQTPGTATGTTQTPAVPTRPIPATRPPAMAGRPGQPGRTSQPPRTPPIPFLQPDVPPATPGVGRRRRRFLAADAEIEFDVPEPDEIVAETFDFDAGTEPLGGNGP